MMKKILVFLSLAVCGLTPLRSSAQLNVNVNIGSQPLWGPVGYDHVDYYYLPDIESYYYVPRREFIYLNNGSWIFSPSMPSRYRNYDLYKGYKVVINAPKPYLQFKQHKVKYAKYKSNRPRGVIMGSNEPKYYSAKGHPKNGGKKNMGNGKGHSSGKGKGKH